MICKACAEAAGDSHTKALMTHQGPRKRLGDGKRVAINNVHFLHDLDLAWNNPAEAARFADHATTQPPRLRSTMELLRRAFSCPSNDRYGMVSDDLASSEVVETADAGSGPVVAEEQDADLNTHGEAVLKFKEPMNRNAARLRWHRAQLKGRLPRK